MPLSPLSPEHRRFLSIDQGVHPAIFNFALNAGIAWLLMRANPFLTLWDEGAVGPDLLITGVLLPLLSCLIVTRIVMGQINSGKVTRLDLDAARAATSAASRRSPLLRSLFLGVVGLLLAAVTVIGLQGVLGGHGSMSVGTYVAFKGVWTAVLAAVLSPLIAWWALVAASGQITAEA